MAIDSKEKHKDIKTEMQKERRSFLKKSAYSVPVLVSMGALLRPTKTHARFGPPPSAPNWPDE